MKPLIAGQNQLCDTHGWLRVGRMPVELTWAAISSPMVAILVLVLLDIVRESGSLIGDPKSDAAILIPLMLGGMAVLSSFIYFDCRAKESFRSGADKIRTTQGITTAITMIFLAVAATAQSDAGQASEAAAFVLFLCLPVLFACAGLLWHAATLIRSSFHRRLMLAGFLSATALVEWLSVRSSGGNSEERLFMLNSLLVALAFGIHLSVWSARVLGRR